MLAAASEEMSSISQQVSTTAFAQEQQANLIATAINEMSAAIQEVASSALATSERANQADEKTQSGYDKVNLNIRAIEQLSTAIHGASQVIEQLNGESEKISQVLAVIQSIAAQTNLLALNAAIEAARAGEAGRGFTGQTRGPAGGKVAGELHLFHQREHVGEEPELQDRLGLDLAGGRCAYH